VYIFFIQTDHSHVYVLLLWCLNVSVLGSRPAAAAAVVVVVVVYQLNCLLVAVVMRRWRRPRALKPTTATTTPTRKPRKRYVDCDLRLLQTLYYHGYVLKKHIISVSFILSTPFISVRSFKIKELLLPKQCSGINYVVQNDPTVVIYNFMKYYLCMCVYISVAGRAFSI